LAPRSAVTAAKVNRCDVGESKTWSRDWTDNPEMEVKYGRMATRKSRFEARVSPTALVPWRRALPALFPRFMGDGVQRFHAMMFRLGLTLKHDYGVVPPGYVFIENRATVCFTLQSAEK
jgi:hypothetical protein